MWCRLFIIQSVLSGFRLASAIPAGTLTRNRAVSSVLPVLRIAKEASIPVSTTSSSTLHLEAPRNLTLLSSGIDPNGRAYLQVAWTQSDQRPLEVDRYRITWRQEPHLSPADEFRKTINGDMTSYTIENLDPDAEYQVDVQGFRWLDDKKLRSSRAVMSARTPPRPSSVELNSGPGLLPNHSTLFESSGILVQSVFYHNGLLKANVTWTPSSSSSSDAGFVVRWYAKVCVAWEKRLAKDHLLVKPLVASSSTPGFVVFDLEFSCRYAVAVYQKMNDMSQNERLLGVRHFMTPSCYDVTVMGVVRPVCPKPASKAPSEPRNLTCFFLVQSDEISATCSWEPPEASAGELPVLGYRAIFAPKSAPLRRSDHSAYLVKVLDEDELSFSVANLESESEHIVYVQALSSAGFGSMAQLDLTSPGLGHSWAMSQKAQEPKSPDRPLRSQSAQCRSSVLLFLVSLWSFIVLRK